MNGDGLLPSMSIVTPNFQGAEHLEATITSVLSQEYPRLQYAVVDGGSDDGSVDIIRTLEDGIDWWVSEPDKGQADALNKGFSRSTGEIMGWLNSDDAYLPGALRAVGRLFGQHPQVEWVTGLPALMNDEGSLVAVVPLRGYFRSLLRRGYYHGRGLGFVHQEGTFWRRSLWERAGGRVRSDLHYAMDYELWRRFAAHAHLVSAATVFAGFRVRPGQKTAGNEDAYHEEVLRISGSTRAFEAVSSLLGSTPLRQSLMAPIPTMLGFRARWNPAARGWRVGRFMAD